MMAPMCHFPVSKPSQYPHHLQSPRPTRRRTLTIHEAARLQSFPDWFDFFPPGAGITRSAAQTAIGNAVPPALAFVIGLWAAAALGDRLHDAPVAEHRTGTDSQRPLARLPA